MSKIIKEGSYKVASREYLKKLSFAKKFLSGVSVGFVMERKGQIQLTDRAIILSGYAVIDLSKIVSLEVNFDQYYKRYYALGIGAGASGSPSRIGGIRGGEPLIVTYLENDITKTIYILIDWEPITGLTKDHEWLESINGLLAKRNR